MAENTGRGIRRGVRRDIAPDLTARKRGELQEIAARWHAARDFYLRRLSNDEDLVAVVLRPRSLRERQRDEGWAPVRLAVHYQQTAFLSAAAEVKTNWLSTLGRVRWHAFKRLDLSPIQKRWIRTVTKRPQLAQRCILGDAVSLAADWARDLDQPRECRRLRRLTLRAHARSRPARQRNWFIVDGRLYRPFLRAEDRHYKGAWIAMTGLELFQRVHLPLLGRTLVHLEARAGTKEGAELRVVLDENVALHTSEFAEVAERPRHLVAGIDKGHHTLLTVSFGDHERVLRYGAGIGERVSTETINAEEGIRARRRLAAYERSLRNSSSGKARRIRRSNLRDRKRVRNARRVSRRMRDEVNASLNHLFRDHPGLARLHVEALDFVGTRRGHAFNRRLRRWLKGFLHRRLAYKAELNGVELIVVNAAYTSQTCTRCWFTSARNRRAERFECGSCGFTGSADAVAATNVLRRGSDPAFARFMPSGAVKQILDERWRSALSGSAWGSNGAMLGEDVAENRIAAGAANNCRVQSIGTGLESICDRPPEQGSNGATEHASTPINR